MLVDGLRAEIHPLSLGQGIYTRRALVVVHAVGRTARLGAVLTRHASIALELLLSTAQARHDRSWALTGLGRVHEVYGGDVAGMLIKNHRAGSPFFSDRGCKAELPGPAMGMLLVFVGQTPTGACRGPTDVHRYK